MTDSVIALMVVSGQWKQCSDVLMKIELLSAPSRLTLKRGSLFHEIGSVTQPEASSAFMNRFANNVYTAAGHIFEKSPPPPVRFLIDALVIVFKQHTKVHAWHT